MSFEFKPKFGNNMDFTGYDHVERSLDALQTEFDKSATALAALQKNLGIPQEDDPPLDRVVRKIESHLPADPPAKPAINRIVDHYCGPSSKTWEITSENPDPDSKKYKKLIITAAERSHEYDITRAAFAWGKRREGKPDTEEGFITVEIAKGRALAVELHAVHPKAFREVRKKYSTYAEPPEQVTFDRTTREIVTYDSRFVDPRTGEKRRDVWEYDRETDTYQAKGYQTEVQPFPKSAKGSQTSSHTIRTTVQPIPQNVVENDIKMLVNPIPGADEIETKRS